MNKYTTAVAVIFVFAILRVHAVSLDFAGREAATVGIGIIEIESGQIVDSENYGKAMIPASILKSVTAASVLNAIGDSYCFLTSVEMTGTFDGRVLDGDLVVKASGDPTVDSSFFPSACGMADSIVSHLKAMGVKEINGEIVIDEDNFQDPGQNPQWVIEDVGWSYGAGLYGFNYKDNIFKLYPEELRTVPEVPMVDVIIEKTSSSTDIIKGINSDLYLISGRDVDNKNFAVTTTMNSPASAFLIDLRSKIAAAGISILEQAVASSGSATEVYTHISPSFGDILHSLMIRSDNMMAEGMLRALSPGASRRAAIDKVKRQWDAIGVSTEYLKMSDGSGLARSNRVTPRFMAEMLTCMARGENGMRYVSLFPRVGHEGTVKSLLRHTSLDGKLVLKSGSMNGVHCYAGYKLGTDGSPTHAVVIMVNNFYCSRDQLRKAIERYLLAIFK